MARVLMVFVALLLPATSQAASVFLNGVNIDGVTNQQFKNCTVKIDAAGNVLIIAKGYAVKGANGQAPQAPVSNVGGPPTKHYFLVTNKSAPGMTQYDIDLFIDHKWVRKLLSEEENMVLDITKYLKTGPNEIRFIAKKDMGNKRLSSSPRQYFRIVIGEGDASGRNVMITNKLIDYKRTAMETQDFNDVQTIDVQ